MGTSKSFPTPAGGSWSPLKQDITKHLGGNKKITPNKIIGGTVRALSGLGMPSPGSAPNQATKENASGGGRGKSGKNRSVVGKSTANIAGFAGAFISGGLGGALDAIGLKDLEGKSAAEIITAIVDKLVEGENPLQYELLSDALKDALIEAAALDEAGEYADLEGALQFYLDQNGIEGLVQLFLTNYVFIRVWMAVESHAHLKSEIATVEAFANAVNQACRSHVESLLSDAKEDGTFGRINWFGKDGIQSANDLILELETRLVAL